jgi:hypothetical protein
MEEWEWRMELCDDLGMDPASQRSIGALLKNVQI